MSQVRYLHFCDHEQFPPVDLLRQAVDNGVIVPPEHTEDER